MSRALVGYLAGAAGAWAYAACRAHSTPPYVGVPDPRLMAVGGAIGALIASIGRR